MRIVYIGCVEFSKSLLECVFDIEGIDVVGIVTKHDSKFNSDFCSLESEADAYNIPCFLYDKETSIVVDGILYDKEDRLYNWVKEKKPDVIYCFGWSHLLREDLISIPRIGVIGHHPAMLPKNRGRHPVIWTLVLGLRQTASSFFFMDAGVDSGDILSQILVEVNFDDNAHTLYQRITSVAKRQIKSFSLDLISGRYERKRQNYAEASFWRKRTKADGFIDWRMSSYTIYNLVRALTRPYIGAHCVYNNEEIKIWGISVSNSGYYGVEPGKIVNVNNDRNEIYIKCGDGVMLIKDHEFNPLPEIGTYL